jgi:hypothetical protein
VCVAAPSSTSSPRCPVIPLHPCISSDAASAPPPCRFIRQVLDRSGGSSINIIAKIENEAGLEHYDDILSVTDGIMVARGDLAMEVCGGGGGEGRRGGVNAVAHAPTVTMS